ncbi:hypothetical protein Pmani_038141 [Petrolisthes manimaculis]|uniref:CHK kinase-like domain-containing protein n=1 Tax=Petrolisthes manimaculis TaxID=1843537 RepID=A0AAE1TKP6_9EUCA|nr:hypothetical protein Pmani_038141 [Petrolisthes manimaculis]
MNFSNGGEGEGQKNGCAERRKMNRRTDGVVGVGHSWQVKDEEKNVVGEERRREEDEKRQHEAGGAGNSGDGSDTSERGNRDEDKESNTGENNITGEGEADRGAGGTVVVVLKVEEAGVKAALQKDKGEGANVVEWTQHDFTRRGDNYVAQITSVKVKYLFSDIITKKNTASDTKNTASDATNTATDTTNTASDTKNTASDTKNTASDTTNTASDATNTASDTPIKPSNTTNKTSNTTNHKTSYVVKMRQGDGDFETLAFNREADFYMDVAPLLDSALVSHHLAPLRRPGCVHVSRGQLFLEDLRARGFLMPDRRRSLNLLQARLAVEELARLHAASRLLLASTSSHAFSSNFSPNNTNSPTPSSSNLAPFSSSSSSSLIPTPSSTSNLPPISSSTSSVATSSSTSNLPPSACSSSSNLPPSIVRLSTPVHASSPVVTHIFGILFNGGLTTAAEVAKAAGREDVREWLQEITPRVPVLMASLTSLTDPKYEVICHGDCWINNLLFREDEQGDAVEVALLDFQLCRRSTLAMDLHYLLFTSLTHEARTQHLPSLLSAYHASFTTVMHAAGKHTPFTLAALTEEFNNKRLLGVIYGILALPVLVCEPADAQDFTVASPEEAIGYVERKRKSVLAMLDTNSLMRPRLLSLYRDIESYIQANKE